MLEHYRRRHSLRTLLSATFSALFVLLLLVLSVVLYWQLQRYLWREGEHRLRDAATVGIEHTYGAGGVPADWARNAQTLAREAGAVSLLARVMRADGTVLASVGGPDPGFPIDTLQIDRFHRDQRVAPPRSTVYLAHNGRQHWQTLLVPLRGDGILEVAADWGPSADVLSALLGYLLGGALVTIVLALLAARAMARAIAAPLERVAATTRLFADGDLDARTGIVDGPNEVDTVGSAFDTMARGLQQSFESQRRFVADASHELKTPLTTIAGMTDILLLDMTGDDPAKKQRALQALSQETARMSRLVNDLLDLSRLDASREMPDTPVSVSELLRELESYAAFQGRPVHFTPVEATVTGDRDQLARVLRNLVDNAFKYGGNVWVTASCTDNQVRLEVLDDGPGIAASDLPHVFDRFYRADTSRTRASGGSGLGLSIVKAAVSRHGGAVQVDSNEGEGTRVTVTLPLRVPPRA